MNILKRAWQWLLIKHQKESAVTDQVVEISPADITSGEVAQTEPSPAAEVVADPAAEASAGVKDFEAALEFVESGVVKLGDAAKDELKALAKKYL